MPGKPGTPGIPGDRSTGRRGQRGCWASIAVAMSSKEQNMNGQPFAVSLSRGRAKLEYFAWSGEILHFCHLCELIPCKFVLVIVAAIVAIVLVTWHP